MSQRHLGSGPRPGRVVARSVLAFAALLTVLGTTVWAARQIGQEQSGSGARPAALDALLAPSPSGTGARSTKNPQDELLLFDRELPPLFPHLDPDARPAPRAAGPSLRTLNGVIWLDRAGSSARARSPFRAAGREQRLLVALQPGQDRAAAAAALRGAGMRVLGPYGPAAIVVSAAGATAVEALAQAAASTHVIPFGAELIVDARVGQRPVLTEAEARSPVIPLRAAVFPGQDPMAAAADLQAFGASIRSVERVRSGLSTVRFDLPYQRIIEAAEGASGVFRIEEELPFLAADEEMASTVQVGGFLNAQAPYWDAGIDGGGGTTGTTQVVAVTDTGLSYDALHFSDTVTDAGVPGPSHAKVLSYTAVGSGDLLSCDGAGSGGSTHGNIVAGMAVGNVFRHGIDLRNNTGWDTAFSGRPADGVAPGSLLVFQDGQNQAACSSAFDTVSPGSLAARMDEARALGARVHNMSFAAVATQGAYTIDSIDVDQFLRENADYMAVIAVGNEGADFNGDGNYEFGSISAPGTAKNAIGVGASNFPNEPINPFDPNLAQTPGVPNDGVNLLSVFQEGSTARGPATNPNRIKPDVMAPGQDVFPNLRVDGAAVCRSSDDDNDSATGGVECILDDDNDGTSHAAAGVTGAAALIRDYFVQGFSDDGAAGGPAEGTSLSGAAVKALIIGSAEFMRPSPAFKFDLVQPRFDVPDIRGRFNPEQGYGRVKLLNILPLNTDPRTPSGLIVQDAGAPGGLLQGGTSSQVVTALSADEEIRVVLAWMDPPDLSGTGLLINDLDLEVIDHGPDNIFGNMDDVLYRGNFFTEDQGDYDGRLSLFDPNLPSVPGEDSDGDFQLDESEYSLPVFPSIRNYRDTDNPNEAVFLSPDPDGDGDPADAQVFAGRDYTIRVVAPQVTSPFEVIITAGGNATLDTVTLLGDDTLSGGGDAVTAGPDGIADTVAEGDDVQVVAVGQSAPQAFALIVAGGITSTSSVRLDDSDYLCNDLLVVTVLDPTSALTPGDVTSALTIEVRDAMGMLMDSEGAVTFTQPDAGVGRFVGDALAVIDGVVPVSNDGILSVQDGAELRAIYADADGPQREFIAHVSCSAGLSLATIAVPGTNQNFNVQGGCDPPARRDPRGVLVGFNQNDPGDMFLDAGESLTYSVAFLNQELQSDLIDAVATLEADVPLDSPNEACRGQRADQPGPCQKIEILNPIRDIGLVPRGTLQSVTFDVRVLPDVAFPEQIDMRFALSARRNGLPVPSTPSSGAVDVIFRHTLNMDEETFHYSTDLPTGGSETRIYAGEFFDPLNFELAGETFTFADATTTAFGGGNPQWDPNAPGPKAPWTFDLDDEGFTTSRRFDSNPGLNLQLNLNLWYWRNTGECGFQSNAGVCSGGFNDGNPCGSNADCEDGMNDGTCTQLDGQGGQGGIWHTGTIGLDAPEPNRQPTVRDGFDLGCEDFDVPSDPGTPTNESVLDVVSSPVFHRVHQNPDANGFEYTLEFTRFAFNAQVDTADANVIIGWELDPDTTTPSPVDPLDLGWLNLVNSARGFLSGVSQIPYPTFDPNDPNDPGAMDGAGPEGPGSVGPFYDPGDTLKAPSRSLGEVGGTGFGTIQQRGAGGLPLRNFEEILDGFYGGDTTFEDIFGRNENSLAVPPNRRDDFQVNFAMFVKENSNPTIMTIPSYGIGIDDVVVEWKESHPIEDATPCVTVDPMDPNALGGCGRVSWDRSVVYESEEAAVLTIQDPDASVGPDGIPGTGDEQAVDSDGDGFLEITARVFSDVDLVGEELTLVQTAFLSPLYETSVQLSSTTGLNSDTDGIIFMQQNGDGSVPVVITAQYNDQDDGTGMPCANNPIQATMTTQFVGGNVLFVAAKVTDLTGDLDDLPDDSETVRLDITVVSNLLDSAENPVILENVRIFLSSVDPDVACIIDNVANYGDLTPGEAVTNPQSDAFEFVVGEVNRSSTAQIKRATFSLGIDGAFVDINGQRRTVSSFATPQQFDLNLDLDLAGMTAAAPDFVENWDSTAAGGDDINTFTSGPLFSVNDPLSVDGSRCQYNDPAGPNSNGGGRSLQFCVPWTGSDWHVHSASEGAFVAAKAYSGDASLLMGTHEAGADSSFDGYTTGQLSVAESPIFNIGFSGGATLSFRHIVAFADDRTFTVPSGEAADRAVVQVAQVDPMTGVPISAWKNISAFQNNYANQGTGAFINCKFDPVDDEYDTFNALPAADPLLPQNIDGVSTEDDYFDPNDPERRLGPSSTCFPQFVFAFMGDWTSSNPLNSGKAFVPGEPGATGNGIWVESVFSLDPFAGQTVRVRLAFAGLELNGPTGNRWPQFFGNQLGNATRGWILDDFRVTGLIDGPANLIADTKMSPAPTCPADPDPGTPVNEAACGVATAVGGPDIVSPAPGFLVTLDASDSLLDSCVDGFIEYRWRQGSQVVQDWSNRPLFRDNPVFSSVYFIDVRCSIDPECTDTQAIQVTIGGTLREVSQGGSESPLLVVSPVVAAVVEGPSGNGLADTAVAAETDDVQEIAVGLPASPGAVIVSAGPDGVLQTVPAGDDTLSSGPQDAMLDWEDIGPGIGYDVQRVDISAFAASPIQEDRAFCSNDDNLVCDPGLKVCVGGSNDGSACATTSECPGGSCDFDATTACGDAAATCEPVQSRLSTSRLCRLTQTGAGVVTYVDSSVMLSPAQVIGYLVNARRVSDAVPGSLGAGLASSSARVPRPEPPTAACP